MRVSPRMRRRGRAPGHSRTIRARLRVGSRDPSRPSHRASSGASCSRPGPTSSSSVGAQARLVRRGDHHAGLAHHREIAQQRIGMHVIDDGADPFGETDRRARAGDVGAEAGDERTAARGKQSGRFG